MDKKATGGKATYTDLGWFLGRINNLRFQNAVLAGVLGGGGVSAAAGLLRMVRDRSLRENKDTDDETIVLNLPAKEGEAAFESMKGAKPGESKPTANGGTQLRVAGRFGKKITKEVSDATPATKTAAGDAGDDSVMSTVANTLGMTAGGLMAYDVVGRLFDRLQERRLKKKLEAAQQAYVDAMTGVSKRAEIVNAVLKRSEDRFGKAAETKEAGMVSDSMRGLYGMIPGHKVPSNILAGYILALLAGTGASAYVTKKVMDREFPEEKPNKDINRPTRIVFKTVGGSPALSEYDGETEKAASDETCAAISAMLPIYMDVVEGKPSRTLDPSYVKLAESMGTDSAGLLKAAADDMWPVYMQILRNPRVLWDILKRTNFGLNLSQRGVMNILRQYHPSVMRGVIGAARKSAPEMYRSAVNTMLAPNQNDGFWKSTGKAIGRHLPNWAQDIAVDVESGVPGAAGRALRAGTAATLGYLAAPFTGGTSAVAGTQYAMSQAPYVKKSEDDTILGSNYLASVLRPDKEKEEGRRELPDPKAIRTKVKAMLKQKRRVTVTGADANAKAYIAANGDRIRKLLSRLNAQGTI